jgi:hypothetical protein
MIAGQPPTSAQLEAWMGRKAYGFWTRVSEWIARSYPIVFTPERLFGGKKWLSLRVSNTTTIDDVQRLLAVKRRLKSG